MRVALLALVFLLHSFVFATKAATAQGQRGQQPNSGVVAQLNRAQSVAAEAANQQRQVQNQTALLVADTTADAQQRVQEIARQRQLVTDTVNGLLSQLRDLQGTRNREASMGAAEANNMVKQNQFQARGNYAQQMLLTGVNNRADGNATAAAARFNDAAQQDRQIQEMLDKLVNRLAQTSQAAKNSPPDEVEEDLPVRKATLEGLLTLPAAPRSKSSVAGVVLAADTGKPMPNATVMLSRSGRLAAIVALLNDQPPPAPIEPTTTDETGHFAFNNLEADSYIVNVIKTGYVLEAGQQTSGKEGPGTPVRLDSGMAVLNLELRVARLGSLAGHIRDLSGKGAAGVPVQLLRSLSNSPGAPSLRLVAETRSDERGEYRLDDIVPGPYILAAGDAIALTGADGEFGYTFYPGTSSADLAARLALGGGEVTADFSLSPDRRHRISGRVVDGVTGSWPTFVTSTLRSVAPTGIARSNAADDRVLIHYEPRAGTFEVSDLLSGTYTISMSARTDGGQEQRSGNVTVVVKDSDIEGERIVLLPMKPATRP